MGGVKYHDNPVIAATILSIDTFVSAAITVRQCAHMQGLLAIADFIGEYEKESKDPESQWFVFLKGLELIIDGIDWSKIKVILKNYAQQKDRIHNEDTALIDRLAMVAIKEIQAGTSERFILIEFDSIIPNEYKSELFLDKIDSAPRNVAAIYKLAKDDIRLITETPYDVLERAVKAIAHDNPHHWSLQSIARMLLYCDHFKIALMDGLPKNVQDKLKKSIDEIDLFDSSHSKKQSGKEIFEEFCVLIREYIAKLK